MVEHRTVNQGDGGSIPPTTISKLRQFRSPNICLCLLEDTLKADGSFYLVSMPGQLKNTTRGKCVTCSGLTNSREGQLLHLPKFGLFGGNYLIPEISQDSSYLLHDLFDLIISVCAVL